MHRRTILRGMLAAGGALALGACATGTSTLGPGTGGNARLTGGRVSVRWLGGGVVELATADYKQIAYGDAWFWNNAGWSRVGIAKPPADATSDGFAKYVAGKHPVSVVELLTHVDGAQ